MSLLLTPVAFANPFIHNVVVKSPGAERCITSGGEVVDAVPQFDVSGGIQRGEPVAICRFNEGNTSAYVGLTTLGPKPNIAATIAQTMQMDPNKPMKGVPTNANPGPALCKLLGGSSIPEYANGGFDFDTPPLGEVSMCYFGDGSSISGSTLMYILLGTEKTARNAIQSDPLEIRFPDIQ